MNVRPIRHPGPAWHGTDMLPPTAVVVERPTPPRRTHLFRVSRSPGALPPACHGPLAGVPPRRLVMRSALGDPTNASLGGTAHGAWLTLAPPRRLARRHACRGDRRASADALDHRSERKSRLVASEPTPESPLGHDLPPGALLAAGRG